MPFPDDFNSAAYNARYGAEADGRPTEAELDALIAATAKAAAALFLTAQFKAFGKHDLPDQTSLIAVLSEAYTEASWPKRMELRSQSEVF